MLYLHRRKMLDRGQFLLWKLDLILKYGAHKRNCRCLEVQGYYRGAFHSLELYFIFFLFKDLTIRYPITIEKKSNQINFYEVSK